MSDENKDVIINQSSDSAEDAFDFFYYLEVLARNWQIFLKVITASIILSVIYSISLPDIYSSTASILPPQQDTLGLIGGLIGGADSVGGMAANLLGKGSSADLYVGILNSDAISDRIIDRFKLMEVYNKKYRVDMYKFLAKKVDISVGKKDGIININVEDENPRLAADIANAYVEELGVLTARLNITGASQSRAFYEERLKKAKSDLAKAEDSLKTFQSKNKIISVDSQAQATITSIAQLKAQLVSQEVQLATLHQQFTDNNQEVKSVKASINNLHSQIDRLEGAGEDGAILGVGAVPALGQQYIRLMREFKVQESIVELLTNQYEMAKLSEAKDSTPIQIIQAARVPDKKIKPHRSFIVLATTIAALLVAVLYVFIREASERMSPQDRERWDRIRTLLPNVSGIMQRFSLIVSKDKKNVVK